MQTRLERSGALMQAADLLGDMSVAFGSREFWMGIAEEMLRRAELPLEEAVCRDLSLAFRWLADEVADESDG